MYDKDIVKDPNHKLSMWQYWYALNEETATELLEDGDYYLLLYDDFKIPVIGRFSKDCNWFDLAAPVSSISVDDPKLTHFTDLFSRDEYLELISMVNKGGKIMSKAKRCDRCGKYYDLVPENLPGTKTGPKYYIQYFKKLGNLGASVESFDLCPECAQQLTDWAENPDDVFLLKKEDDDEKYQPSYLQWPEPRGGE